MSLDVGRVVGDITISVDGFVSGAGEGVEAMHAWALTSSDPVDAAELATAAGAGAVLMGRATFDVVDGPDGWRDGLGYAARLDARPPFVVVTGVAPERARLADTHDVTFVAGLADAVDAARELAGDGDVFVMGGGATVGGCLAAGLLDELRLHVAPEVLGSGTPLVTGSHHRLAQREVRVSAAAVHLTYDVTATGPG